MIIPWDRSIIHRNITIRKAFYFSVTAGIGAVITWALTWMLTEWSGLWYMWSVVIAGIIAIAVKFFITAVWVFK